MKRSNHGLFGIPEYWVWNQMKQRCYNRKHRAFKNYGGRGIKVCERWHSFVNFIKDMGQRPSPTHTLERTDNSRDYSPSNCCWATRTTQGRNTRRVRLSLAQAEEIRVAYRNGEQQRAIAKRFGISHGYVSKLVNNQFWKS